MMANVRLYIVTGPSASGKTTFVAKTVAEYPNIKKVITYTTRKMRDGEKPGVSYNFVSPNIFKKMEKNNEFSDSRVIFGNYYGIRDKDILDNYNSGFNQIVDLDTDGALKISNIYNFSKTIFLLPNSIEILKRRLEDRGTFGIDLEMRLRRALQDIDMKGAFDHVLRLETEDAVIGEFTLIHAEND